MTRNRPHDLRHAKMWCTALLISFVIGSCSVAFAYSGEQTPKNSTTPMLMALAASFNAR